MATTAESGSGGGEVLRSERIAAGILPKVLNSFDMVAIFVAIVLFISNAGVIPGAGASAYIYWILGFLTFLIPGAIVTGQLGLMFPGEGSIYVWTNKAFGAFLGFFAGFCAWWPGVLVMIATGDAVVTLIQQLGGQFNASLLSDPWQQGLVIVAVIAFSFILSVLRFRVTQNFVNVVFVAYGGAILLIGLAGVLWLAGGHAPQADFSAHSWSLNGGNYTFFGLVVLALLGIEVPLNMGVEINNVRSITRYLLWGSVVVMAAYLIGTFGVMMAVPASSNNPNVVTQGNPAAIAAAVQIGFGGAGNVLGAIVDLIFIGFFLFNTAVYNYSFGRLLFVSGLDQRLPAVMSKVNANKVPWVAVLVQSIISGIFTIVAFILIPYTLKTGLVASDLSTVAYDILQAAVTVIWCVSMVILFIDVVIIRFKYQETFTRIRLAPVWVFYLCSIIGLIASGFGVYVTFLSPWTNSATKTLMTTSQWDLWIGGIGVISLLIGIVVFFIGQATIKKAASDDEVIAQVTGGSAAG
ncbi:MAG TPA: amino acid permease [Ktedonobacteraceae bacterium]|nr:amino acid permease [Ktedonobacteraceae bacterium]